MPKSKPQVSNEVKSLTPQCKVVIYPWKISTATVEDRESFSFRFDDSELAKSTSLDISSQILSCDFTKTMNSPTGTFSFQLANGENTVGDWKDVIKRGTWCVIYMSQDGSLTLNDTVSKPKNQQNEFGSIRCVGYIDRTSVSSSMSEDGAYDVTFNISGRDFGVVYEDTAIWHNMFQFDQIMLDALGNSNFNVVGTKKLNEIIEFIHDLFYNPSNIPGAKVNDQKSLTTTALQWLLPKQLVNDLGLGGAKDTFWGSLNTKQIEPTAATLAAERPTDFLSGNAWEVLKRLSSPAFHELFTEISEEGRPELTFRPIPFSINNSKYPRVGQYITKYKNLNYVDLKAIDVLDFELGEDGHSRYNSFLATLETTLIQNSDNINYLSGQGFPKFLQSSIKRHGFRPMHVTVDNIVKDALNGTDSGTPILLKEFNEVLFDYWRYSVLAESGSFSLVGRNDIKIGKCLLTDLNIPYAGGRRYYIEGYSDRFMVGEDGAGIWTQEVNVTRGFSEEVLNTENFLSSSLDSRDEPVKTSGEFTKGEVNNEI